MYVGYYGFETKTGPTAWNKLNVFTFKAPDSAKCVWMVPNTVDPLED